MINFFNRNIPSPENWQDFEKLCCDLWREIWRYKNAQKNGRGGQSQHGVDISGQPNQNKEWAGVQCKGKNDYKNKTLTIKEINSEVEKAIKFKPKLSEFIIATSGEKDVKIEELARRITNKHQKIGLFSVHVFAWEDIKNYLDFYPEVKKVHYKEFCGIDDDENEYNLEIDYSREMLNKYKPENQH